MTTIYQFLKISEFMESHRISSISYGKLARNLTVELNLPVKDRGSGGAECIKISRTEIDRLIEQSPAIPKKVLMMYEQKFAGQGLSEPEIVIINKVGIYTDQENKTAMTVAEAGMKLKALTLKKKPTILSESNVLQRKENLNKELGALPKLRSFNLFKPQNDQVILQIEPEILPVFKNIQQELDVLEPIIKRPSISEPKVLSVSEPKFLRVSEPNILSVSEPKFLRVSEPNILSVSELEPEVLSVSEPNILSVSEPEPEVLSTSELEFGHETIFEIMQPEIDNLTVIETTTIQDDLELLRNSKLVSTKKENTN